MKAWLRNAIHGLRGALYVDPKRNQRLGRRVVDVLSEIGVLLVVFGPLELVLRQSQASTAGRPILGGSAGWSIGWTIFLLGLALIAGALLAEWRFLGND